MRVGDGLQEGRATDVSRKKVSCGGHRGEAAEQRVAASLERKHIQVLEVSVQDNFFCVGRMIPQLVDMQRANKLKEIPPIRRHGIEDEPRATADTTLPSLPLELSYSTDQPGPFFNNMI